VATKTAKRPSARERLLAASDELFYRDGVHSTGIDAVIAKAGVAKGSLYYIFGGKDELVAAIADYVSLPGFRGCPFVNAAAEAPAGESHQQAIEEYRDWIRQIFVELAAATGIADSEALADALVLLYDGALATASTAEPARTAAMTAKRIARLTLAAANASRST
jgi:AcrR family transcriptional regulator